MNKYAQGTVVRREEIIKLVRDNQISSQEELLRQLNKRGFIVTQPTLSRDIKSLGLAKTQAGYVSTKDLTKVTTKTIPSNSSSPGSSKLTQLMREFVVGVDLAASMIVIRTTSASAHTIARAIDEARLNGVLGTIAGDDTIFIAGRSQARLVEINRHLQSLMTPASRLTRDKR